MVGGGCMGASAMRGMGGGGACIGRSAIFAAPGSDAASGDGAGGGGATTGGAGTTRRLARVLDGATAADSAEGDCGVTPLFCRSSTGEEAILSGAFSLRILSTVFS